MIAFSVVSVTLNDLVGLRRTFESIKRQTYQDFEWLVIDGRSRDGTVNWLDTLEFEPLRWWSEPDAGLYDAMNKGIDRARGRYLLFLNGGDEFATDDVLQRVAEAGARDERCDFIFGDSLDVTPDGKVLYRTARTHRALWWTMFTAHQSMFFRSKRVGDVRYRLEYRFAADFAFVAEFLDRTRSGDPVVARLDIPICRFWLGGASWRHRSVAIREDYLIRRRHLRMWAPLCVGLLAAHEVHLWVKRAMPGLARRVRYKGAGHHD